MCSKKEEERRRRRRRLCGVGASDISVILYMRVRAYVCVGSGGAFDPERVASGPKTG